MRGARFSHFALETLGRLHGCQGQFRRSVQPQMPLRRISPMGRRVSPAVFGRPIPALVGACMPTHFVSRVEGPIAQPTPHHMLLRHVQRTVCVVVDWQVPTSVAKQTQPQHIQGVRLDAGLHQFVVTEAVHPFLGGRERQPRTLRTNAGGRPLPRFTVQGHGRSPERRLDADQPLPLFAVPSQRLALAHNPRLTMRRLGRPSPRLETFGWIDLQQEGLQFRRARGPFHPLVQHFHVRPR